MTDEEFAIKLGERIRELRKARNISQLELAYDMEMSMNTISGIELGKISPKIETLRKIALKLDIEVSDLFTFSPITIKDKILRKKVEDIILRIQDGDKDFLELIDSAIDLVVRAQHTE